MRAHPVLVAPLAMLLGGCWFSPPPETTATSRGDAMKRCFAANRKTLEDAKTDPFLTFLRSSEYEDVEILASICKPIPNTHHKGYWISQGRIKWRRTNKWGISEEDWVVVPNSIFVWRE